MQQRSEARDFILGFAIGFTGSFLGLLLGLLHRDYLPGILCGFLASMVFGGLIGAALIFLPELGSALGLLGSPELGELELITFDGSASSSGPSLALTAAVGVGLGVGTLGALGAAILALGGGEQQA